MPVAWILCRLQNIEARLTEWHGAAMKSFYSQIEPYITKDGSEIRELMHPALHGNLNQSLAEATVARGCKTTLHRHRQTEEIYYVVQGAGMMVLGDEILPVQTGDAICIAPGTAHCIENTGTEPLRILCACAPPYDHDDTELLEPTAD
jgi:mannose-6-phosphate isomerase-like protein (cupin superfamily)